MSDPRPNQLAGQVEPNRLSTQPRIAPGSRPASRSQSPIASAPRSTTVLAGSGAPAAPRPVVRRPFRAWVVIVAVVLGINVIRSLGTSGGFGGTGGATTAPGATALAPGSTAKTGAGGKTTTAVEVPAGTVIFGTSLNDACDVSGTATTFASGTPIWWYAHLNVTQASDAKVVTILKHDNEELDRGSGPTSSSGVWDGLCAGGPFKYYGSGPYRFEVWNEDEKLLLASGEYEIGK